MHLLSDGHDNGFAMKYKFITSGIARNSTFKHVDITAQRRGRAVACQDYNAVPGFGVRISADKAVVFS